MLKPFICYIVTIISGTVSFEDQDLPYLLYGIKKHSGIYRQEKQEKVICK